MIIGQFCETYPPALDGVGRVMLAYCQTLSRMGHRCLYIAPRDAAATSVPGLETLLYPSMPIPGEPYRVGIPALGRDFRRAARSVQPVQTRGRRRRFCLGGLCLSFKHF